MFLGVNTLNLDAKGRLAIPAKYRERLADCCESKVVVTINPFEKCLWLYPENEWTKLEAKIAALPNLKAQNRLLQRMLLGYASELETDGQGRILLSTELRKYAGLEKKVALVGQAKKFEIWSEESWMGGRDDWLQEINQLESSKELEDLAL